MVGANNLIARLVRVQKKLPRDADEAITDVAVLIRDTAKGLVPVDTGTLKKSIRLQRTARPAGVTRQIGVLAGGRFVNPKSGRIVNYALFVERGTSRMRPQPYMGPAVQKHAPELARILKRKVRGR